jgi:hypothetical protein
MATVGMFVLPSLCRRSAVWSLAAKSLAPSGDGKIMISTLSITLYLTVLLSIFFLLLQKCYDFFLLFSQDIIRHQHRLQMASKGSQFYRYRFFNAE